MVRVGDAVTPPVGGGACPSPAASASTPPTTRGEGLRLGPERTGEEGAAVGGVPALLFPHPHPSPFPNGEGSERSDGGGDLPLRLRRVPVDRSTKSARTASTRRGRPRTRSSPRPRGAWSPSRPPSGPSRCPKTTSGRGSGGGVGRIKPGVIDVVAVGVGGIGRGRRAPLRDVDRLGRGRHLGQRQAEGEVGVVQVRDDVRAADVKRAGAVRVERGGVVRAGENPLLAQIRLVRAPAAPDVGEDLGEVGPVVRVRPRCCRSASSDLRLGTGRSLWTADSCSSES